ncbi:hypothetical protein MIMGU_mgv1a024835mg [Erythranthe guttata]|uniref:Uncharacterized protein n=1 Tax=Erythranthe guttata TaxID=4155 RepID=A0A022RLQ3_ERYGU|nr:hypothetical protein MIMGU_mgv1a024835mg [Erythranthe guttata]
MEAAPVGAALGVLLPKLISVLEKQIDLFQNFKKDLKKLKISITMIQSFLNDAENKRITNGTVKLWLHKLEGVAFDADNVLDELDYQHLSQTVHPTQHKIKKKVRFFFPRNIRRLKMAHKIKDINKNLKEINKELGPSAGRETDSLGNDPIFLGRENDVSEIVKMMTTPPKGDHVFSILPIVGMGGLGKTTVAREVVDHKDIRTRFPKRFWVHVSENFDLMILFRKILTSLTRTNVKLESRQDVLEELQTYLGAGRFLLVLDDVWNDSEEKWDDFINPLRKISSATGNGIVVTTRNLSVASLVTTLPIHKLNGLSVEECWSIIKAKAFVDGNVPSEFELVGVSIAKNCQGLPLAARMVGRLLRGKSIDEWLHIEKNWLSDLRDENLVYKILKLSFDHLSSPALKKCFAYCSIYPKGYDLQRERLVELWMAEGFLEGNDDMERLGGKFFNLLLENSLLLQIVERNGDVNIIYYNMHDLVHDVASSILNSSDQVRYISWESISGQSRAILKKQASCLRSLRFNNSVCDLVFSKFKSLHVLILTSGGHFTFDELSSSIGELIHLRCLDIFHTFIKCLPNSVGDLYHLQTLRACADLEKLPNTMKHLMNLRHLHLPSRIELPPEMGRLISLRTLLYFGVSDKKGCGIGELKSLKNLKGELEIYNLEKVRDKEEAKMADLLQKSNIVKLKLVWSHGQNGNESVLEGLQPHPNLKSLNICGFPGRNLPSWFSMMSELNNLMEICLRNCKECEKIPMLGHLGHLKNLYLHGMENVKSIGSSFYGIDKCSGTDNRITIFPALERLELVCMWELTEWLEYYNVVLFPRLEYLKIIMCMQLKSAPNWLFHKNRNLSELKILYCPNLKHLVPCFQSGYASLLKKLEISYCPNLKKLPDDLHSLDALEILSIHDCPNLVAIPYPHESHGEQELVLLGLSCLRELSIRKCPGLTELPSEMIESCAESLEKLELLELSNLRMDVGMVTGCLQKMHRLSELRIADIPTTDSSKIGLSSNDSSLRGTLSTGTSCGESSHSSVFDAILKGSAKSLCTLHLYGTKHSRDLPEQLQHLTALYELHLYNFEEIEQFPDWVIGNNNNLSSSLHQICLYNCSKLRRLPSKEAMLRLTSLTNLFIYQSPMLKLTRQPDGDSEWPKISHIPRVILDGVVVPTNVV